MTRKTNKTYKQTGSVMNYVRKAALYHKKASWVEGKLHLGAFITVERHVNDQPNSICYHNIDWFTCFVDHIPQILQACLRCDHCVIKKKRNSFLKNAPRNDFTVLYGSKSVPELINHRRNVFPQLLAFEFLFLECGRICWWQPHSHTCSHIKISPHKDCY